MHEKWKRCPQHSSITDSRIVKSSRHTAQCLCSSVYINIESIALSSVNHHLQLILSSYINGRFSLGDNIANVNFFNYHIVQVEARLCAHLTDFLISTTTIYAMPNLCT